MVGSTALREFVEGLAQMAYDQILELDIYYDASDAGELEVEAVKVGELAIAYVERYGIDNRREIEFVLPLRNPRTRRSSRAYKLGGKIDGAVITGHHHVRIIEDKLVQQIQKVMIERLELDDQVTEYVDAFLVEDWTADVSYRHTRWPGINPTKEKIPPALTPSGNPSTAKYVPAETLDEFRERLRLDILERQPFYFDEQILNFPVHHMEEYRRERWGTAQDILAARRHAGKPTQEEVFYKNPSRCWEYGGCEFIPLCTKIEDAHALYVEVEDNPELVRGRSTEEYATETA